VLGGVDEVARVRKGELALRIERAPEMIGVQVRDEDDVDLFRGDPLRREGGHQLATWIE
jgi:hypothetical protein